jgi:NAD(P)-dependent dehydrogenase (short-subunit alcohol dehydrogenase family)
MTALRGKVALVFGASSGIGRSVALAFAQAGASVAVASRNLEVLQALTDELRATGAESLALAVDVADAGHVDTAVRRVTEMWSGLHIAVNSAGVNVRQRSISAVTQDDWNRVIAVNLTGAFHTTQAAVRYMREHGGGLIIQVSSVSGRWADMSGAAYQASKHGIVGLCQATMFEERLNGIRVTALLPGMVDTPLQMRRPAVPSRAQLDRAMQPQDVGQVCVCLANLPARSYVPELIMLPPELQCVGQTVT